VAVQRKLTRARLVPCFEKLPRCRVGIEACATAHHWGRRLTELGHEVRLMPPSYVKPYLKGQKNDAADAEAICEAVTRPSMRFVEVKSPEQQSELVTLRTRMTLMRHRIELSNTIWAHMAEFDLAALIGLMGLQELIEILRDETDERVPPSARICLKLLTDQLGLVNRQALETDRLILASARATEVGRRLMACPASGRRWPARWSPACLTRMPSRPAATSPPGSGSCRSRIPAVVRRGWAGSPSRATATCANCWSWVRWR
jgi:transposase